MEADAKRLEVQKAQREREEERQRQERLQERQQQKDQAALEIAQARAAVKKEREQRQSDFDQLLQSVKHKLSDDSANANATADTNTKGGGILQQASREEDGDRVAEEQVREAGYWGCSESSGSPESSGGGGMSVSTKLDARLRKFFAENNPSILSTPGKFERLLQIFEGREDELVLRLKRKYQPARVPDQVSIRVAPANTVASRATAAATATTVAVAAATAGGHIEMAKCGRSTNGPKGITGVRHSKNVNVNANANVVRRPAKRSGGSSSGSNGSLPSYMRPTRSHSIRNSNSIANGNSGTTVDIHNRLGIDIAQDARYLQKQREWVRAKRQEAARAFDADFDAGSSNGCIKYSYSSSSSRKARHSVSTAAGASIGSSGASGSAGEDPFGGFTAAASADGFIEMKKRGRNTNGPKGSGTSSARRP